MKNAIWADILG